MSLGSRPSIRSAPRPAAAGPPRVRAASARAETGEWRRRCSRVTVRSRRADDRVSTPGDGAERRTWRRVRTVGMLFACLLGVAAYVVARPASTSSPRTPAGAPGASPSPTAVTTAARASAMSVYLTGLGSVTPLNTVTVSTRVDGELMAGPVPGGADREQRRPAGRDRSAPVQVQLTQAEGQLARDQALLDNARSRSRALPDARRRGLDPEAAARHPGSRWSTSTKAPSRPTRARSTPPSCSSPTAASPRRSAAGSGCASSIPATSSTRATPTVWS